MDTGNCGVFAFALDQVIGPTRTVRVKRSRPRPLLKQRSMASAGSARVVASDNVGAKGLKRAADALS